MNYKRIPEIALAATLFAYIGCGGGGGGESTTGTPSLSEAPSGSVSGENGSSGEGGSGGTGTASPTVETTGTLKISTLNVGLLPRVVPLTEQRVSPLAESLASHDADVLCLQEVWRPQDAAAITGRISSAYPFFHVASARQKLASQLPVCTAEELEPTLLCIAQSCLFLAGEIVECIADRCLDRVNDLAENNPECAQAVFAQAGRSVFELVDVQRELFSDSVRAGLFAFGGSPGVILASKHPLIDVQVQDFFDISTTSRRVAIFATVNINGFNHHVSCTHLTSNLDGLLPYTGSSGSWQGEGAAQAENLLSFARRYAAGGAEYLAGDFNCSQANPTTGVQAEFPSNCERFIRSAYRDDAGRDLGCSFCSSNLIATASGLSNGENVLLDHIFVRGSFGPTVSTRLFFDGPVVIDGAATHLSDHYGVQVEVAIP